MQVETPHHPPSTLADFLRQYAMIVLSILTALALERGAVAMHDSAAARDSRLRVEAELNHDLGELRSSEQINVGNIKIVRASLKTLMDQLKAGTADPQKVVTLLTPAFNHFGISMPTWERDAWDSALADQSASHMAATDLRHYAEVYAAARDADDTAHLLLSGEWLTQAADLRVDFALGHIEGRLAANAMVRYLLAVEQIEATEEAMEALMATPKKAS